MSDGIALLAIVTELVMPYLPSCNQQGNCPPTLPDLTYTLLLSEVADEYLFCVLCWLADCTCICSINNAHRSRSEVQTFNTFTAEICLNTFPDLSQCVSYLPSICRPKWSDVYRGDARTFMSEGCSGPILRKF